jgi:peptidoglycan/xylan/chitin deacetylase (PgdA/CDA1 family)
MVTQRPLILGYHAVSSTWGSSLAVREEELRRHLVVLRERGYEGYTFRQAEVLRQLKQLPPRTVVITFDDGFASVMDAAPILGEAGYPATVFVVGDFVEHERALGWPGLEDVPRRERSPLSWGDLASLIAIGWEVGSHTMTHPLLTELEPAELRNEIVASKELITERLDSCDTLAYPYGIADAGVARHVREAGYTAACVLMHSHRVDEPHRRPRVNISRGDEGVRLALKLSSHYARLRRSRLADATDRIRIRRGGLVPAGRAPSVPCSTD